MNIFRDRFVLICFFSIVLIALPYSASDSVRLTVMGGIGHLKSLLPRTQTPKEHPNEELKSKLIYFMQEAESLRDRMRKIKNLTLDENTKKYQMIIADLVLRSNPEQFDNTIIVSKGQNHGISPGMTAVYNNVFIGRIVSVSPWTSRIMLTTDPRMKVGALITDNEYDLEPRERQVGVTVGDVTLIKLKWISNPEQVENGHYALTIEDPENNIPKGLVIGKIANIKKLKNAYLNIEIQPVLNPAFLEYVFIIKPCQ